MFTVNPNAGQYDERNHDHVFVPRRHWIFQIFPPDMRRYLRKNVRATIERLVEKVEEEHLRASNQATNDFFNRLRTVLNNNSMTRKQKRQESIRLRKEYENRRREADGERTMKRAKIEGEYLNELAHEINTKFYKLINGAHKLGLTADSIAFTDGSTNHLKDIADALRVLSDNGLLAGFAPKLPRASQDLKKEYDAVVKSKEVRKYLKELQDIRKRYAELEAWLAKQEMKLAVLEKRVAKRNEEKQVSRTGVPSKTAYEEALVEENHDARSIERTKIRIKVIRTKLAQGAAKESEARKKGKTEPLKALLAQAASLATQIDFKLQAHYRERPPGEYRVLFPNSPHNGKRLSECPIDYVDWIASGGARKAEYYRRTVTIITKSGKKYQGFADYHNHDDAKPYRLRRMMETDGGVREVGVSKAKIKSITPRGHSIPVYTKREWPFFRPGHDPKTGQFVKDVLVRAARAYLETGEGKVRLAEHERRRTERELGYDNDETEEQRQLRRAGKPYRGRIDWPEQEIEAERRGSHPAFSEQTREGSSQKKGRRSEEDVDIDHADRMRDLAFVRRLSAMSNEEREKVFRFAGNLPHLDVGEPDLDWAEALGGVIGKEKFLPAGSKKVKERETAFYKLVARVDPEWKPRQQEWYTMESPAAWHAQADLEERVQRIGPGTTPETIQELQRDILRLMYVDEHYEWLGEGKALGWEDMPLSQRLGEELMTELTARAEDVRMDTLAGRSSESYGKQSVLESPANRARLEQLRAERRSELLEEHFDEAPEPNEPYLDQLEEAKWQQMLQEFGAPILPPPEPEAEQPAQPATEIRVKITEGGASAWVPRPPKQNPPPKE